MIPRRVVITGLGALTPIGNTLTTYWEGLLSGTSGAGPISYFDPSLFKTQFACELKNFNPLDLANGISYCLKSINKNHLTVAENKLRKTFSEKKIAFEYKNFINKIYYK